MNNIIAVSVAHRGLVLVLAGALALFGLWSLERLPIDAVPDITNKQVQINVSAAALNPLQIEQIIAAPLEQALAGAAGLQSTRSLSRSGFAQITAIFEDSVDIYFARQQISERLRSFSAGLPEGVDVELSPVTTGLGEVLMWTLDFRPFAPDSAAYRAGEPGWQPDGRYLTADGDYLSSERERATYLRSLQDWLVAVQMRAASGVAGVDTIGGYVKQYQVQVHPAALVQYRIELGELAQQIQAANQRAGAGTVARAGESLVLRLDGALTSLNSLAALPIRLADGRVLPLSALAEVVVGHAPRSGAASRDGHETVLGTALMTAGENSRQVALNARAKLEEIQRSLPPDIVAEIVLDRSVLVGATLNTVAHNLTVGALLVVLVLFALLGNWRAAAIAALVIPLSFLFAVIGMRQFGISGNLMSLGALDFGILVDGAVIVVEAALQQMTLRRAELGRALTAWERVQLTQQAALRMWRPAAFGQLIILLVFLPILSFEGVEGKTFQPMAATFMLALVGAFILAFTLVPALAALCLREADSHADSDHETALMAALRRVCEPLIHSVCLRPQVLFAGALAVFGVSALLFSQLGREFMPRLDEGDIALQALRVPSTSLAQSMAMQQSIERALLTLPEVKSVFARTGTAEEAIDPMPVNISDAVVLLRPRAQWPQPSLDKRALIEKLEAALAGQLGSAYEFSQPIELRFNELIAGVRTDLAVKLYGDDFAQLAAQAELIAEQLRQVPGAADVKAEQVNGLPALALSLDRQALARYGLSASAVAAALQASGQGLPVGEIYRGDQRIALSLRLGAEDAAWFDLDALKALPLVAADGQLLRLSQLAELQLGEGINQVSRDNGQRRVVVQANVRGRDLGGFVAEAQQRLAALPLPVGVRLAWGGQFENLARAERRLSLLLPLVIGGILLLLRLALHNWRDALLVFCAVPLALSGGVLLLWLRDMPFSVSAAVGFIAVSGVATLNGLVLLQAIGELLAQGQTALEAAVAGTLSRLRPVLTTATVAIVGFLPMALARGAGAQVQAPLATVVIGGLMTATLLTLLLIPALVCRLRIR